MAKNEKMGALAALCTTVCVFLGALGCAQWSVGATWDLKHATLEISQNAAARLVFADGSEIGCANAFELLPESRQAAPAKSVDFDAPNAAGETPFRVTFSDGAVGHYRLAPHSGFALVTLDEIILPDSAQNDGEMILFRINMPQDGRYVSTINNVIWEGKKFGIMTASLNVRPMLSSSTVTRGDRELCSHTFVQAENAAEDANDFGRYFARFSATSKRKDQGGWSVRGRNFGVPLDLSGCKAIRARVHGDAGGQALKIQLACTQGGHRDDYITINFTGWRTITLTTPALNDLHYDSVRSILFYYNGLPAERSVCCGIDRVEAVFENPDGTERTVLLEDFESQSSPLWEEKQRQLHVRSYARHELAPASFGIIAAPEAEWKGVIQDFQKCAGLPSPRPGGGWRNDSPWTKQSYFFLTNFREEQFDDALAIAKRGGFKQILLLQHSWIKTPGHYDVVSPRSFPEGLPALRRTIERFRAEGIRFGLHFLAASIDPPDAYLTPVPDPRLVTGVETTLAADVSADATFLPTPSAPSDFPINEHAYRGQGQCIWIDDELIYYESLEGTPDAPGFAKCQRGYLGTTPAPHAAGAAVRHLVRAYGYYMYDLDSDLREEVAANVARLVNQLPIDMIYFDGSEKLQRRSDAGDHWYYNAKLHRAFYDALDNKDIMYQASSFSPYSWNQLARSASADGHDDLKAYLDERSPAFRYFADSEMPLDIGWYYGYDRRATPDMYEYVLGATIGYDSSMSFQVSVEAAHAHPFIGEILDMIREYETLRLSGVVPTEMRQRLQIDPRLGGKKEVEERDKLSLELRNEFRLVTIEGKRYFQRVIYPLWHEGVQDGDTWTLEVKKPATIGFQVHYQELPETKKDGKIARPRIEIDGRELGLEMTLEHGQYGFTLPNRPDAKYGKPLDVPEYAQETAAGLRLEPGTYEVRFRCDTQKGVPIRVRTPMFLDERYGL
ncbi:MAG: hypothetical protein Q4D38_07210 [Planctomycetia bacterium]|nr:hypothetical protein [Planctomycetia bacterium]